MDDLIRRQDAIDALKAWEEDSVWDDECLKHRGEPYWVAPSDVIWKLPSAQRKGKWIKQDGWPCSICGYNLGYRMQTNFCSNCGAKMEGRGEDNE